MVSSPTDKGVVVIGGQMEGDYSWEQIPSNALIELSGDTIDTLKWTILKQKLNYQRFLHLSFPISPQTSTELSQKYWEDGTVEARAARPYQAFWGLSGRPGPVA